MYQLYNDHRTQTRYKQIVNETLEETQKLIERLPEIVMYQAIYNQILDIKENIIDKKIKFTRSEIHNRYNLGSIAVHNFNLDHEEYGQRLADIFGGSIDYHSVPEGN